MKQPDVKECPCCGLTMRRSGPVETCEVACQQEHDQDGNLLAHFLLWKCRDCGCQWRDGQFNETKQEAV